MRSQDTQRWVTARALEALLERRAKQGDVITNVQLRDWTGLTTRQVSSAFKKLQQMEFVLRNGMSYTITASGAVAVKSYQPTHYQSGPKGPHGKGREVPAQSFVNKLWKLLRVRITLDCETAANVLVDAGDAESFERTKKTASRYLNHWAKTDAVSASRGHYKRGTCKRYVLMIDSPTPPAWTEKSQARQAAKREVA